MIDSDIYVENVRNAYGSIEYLMCEKWLSCSFHVVPVGSDVNRCECASCGSYVDNSCDGELLRYIRAS
jgi:hypothetical protein